MTQLRSLEAVIACLWEGEVESDDDFEMQANRLEVALCDLYRFDADAITTAFSKVMPLVSHEVPEVRDAALNALLQMIPDVAARALVDALRTRSSRERAARALSIVSRHHLLPDRDGVIQTPIALALREYSSAITAVFIRDPKVRESLTHPVGLIGAGARDHEALSALEAAVTDPDELVRMELPRALAYFGDRAIPSIQKLLVDDAADLAAINALAFVGTPTAIAALQEFAATASPDTAGRVESMIAYSERARGERLALVAE